MARSASRGLGFGGALSLGPDGPLAAQLAGYEERPGQQQMAAAVQRALDEDRILLCEAGTGTGKTLAYLAPAVASGRRVLIATATRALQDQIFTRDLVLLERALGEPISAQLIKGLPNYVCRRRFQELLSAPEAEPAIRDRLPLVERWVNRSLAGDKAELTELPENHPIWPLITSSSATRIGSRCEYHESCFVTGMKRSSLDAQIIVANHHLLIADLALQARDPQRQGSVLPPYDAIIIDEAHRLEDTAALLFGTRITSPQLERLWTEVDRINGHERLAKRCRMLSTSFFSALSPKLHSAEKHVLRDIDLAQLSDEFHAFDEGLEALGTALDEQARSSERSNGAEGVTKRRVEDLRADLSGIFERDPNMVSCLVRRQTSLAVESTPVDVSALLRERLFDRDRACVLTSASMTTQAADTEGAFSFIRGRLGLMSPEAKNLKKGMVHDNELLGVGMSHSGGHLAAPIDELQLPHAFEHERQAILYTPTDLPSVASVGFAAAAAERVCVLKQMLDGGCFVLCTSNNGATRMASQLRALVGDHVLCQGDAPKAALLERFRAEGDGLLVATMSFWEGVDVPGEALQLVAIDRLPFAVPTDPLVQARCRAVELAGGHAFRDYSVPRAAITLKQGVGRLLRSKRDRGVVAIMDRRICERSYGAQLLDALPPMHQTRDLEDVALFWQRKRDEEWLDEPSARES